MAAKKAASGGTKTTARRGSSNAGRRAKTRKDARKRVAARMDELKVSVRQRNELLSLVCSLFCRGCTRSEIEEQVVSQYKETYAKLLRGENFWDLLREAASLNMLAHTPCEDVELTQRLREKYSWLDGHIDVAQTATADALATQAATKLLRMIRNVCHTQRCDTVHVGFAGGMTLRAVAARLAELLNQHHPHNPDTIVFHAMVASFDDDDFYADPNSFITYFMSSHRRVTVRLVRLPLPGMVEAEKYWELRELAGINRVFDRRDEIQIVVTSGSLWSDERSTLRTYMKAASKRKEPKRASGRLGGPTAKSVFSDFEKRNVIGDLLWQPINREGPVEVKSRYKVMTLMELAYLPEFIEKGGSVLMVMGCSGISRRPKSELLKAILDLHPKHNWVTDVVSDSPTVEGMFDPDMRDGTWDSGRRARRR